MRGRIARSALALGSAGLMVFGMAGCQQQSEPSEETAQADLKIVEQVPIDENGKEMAPPDTSAAADPAGDGKATCPPLSIAMAGALTGPDAALGINIMNGVQLAIDKHNAANPGCQVQLKPFDTEGDPQKATAIAPQIVDDQYTIGLVGPAFSGETKATGGVFDQAGLVAMTASATNVTLSENGWKTFFRGLANDGVQGPAVANYLKNTLGYKKVCVVDDSTDYGLGLAQVVRDTLGPVADRRCNISVKKGDKDFSAAVTQVKGASPDAVFYSGYYAEAAPFVSAAEGRRLRRHLRLRRRHQGPGVRQAGRRGVQGRDPVLPVRPGAQGVRRRVQREVQPGARHLQHRGLRPRHDHAEGHRLRRHHPARAAGLRPHVQRTRRGPPIPVDARRVSSPPP